MGRYMWRGQSADTFKNAACRNIFMVSYPLKPGGIALSGNETVLPVGVTSQVEHLLARTSPGILGDAVSNHLLR